MVESPDDPNRSENNKRHWLDHAAVWAASAAALAAGAAAAVGAWQGWIANQGLIEVRKANEIAIRPYIKVTLKPETFIMHYSPTAISNGNPGDASGVKFQVQNIGKLPGLAYIQSAATWNGRGHQEDEKSWPSIGVVARTFLFPGNTGKEFFSQGLALTKGQLADMAGGGTFYVMVDVLYGPSKNTELYGASRDYETKVCTAFLIQGVTDPSGASEIRLSGEGSPCQTSGSNYAQ
jgi:hypothetical protein